MPDEYDWECSICGVVFSRDVKRPKDDICDDCQVNREEVFWISIKAVRKQYRDGLITKIQYLVTIIHLCNNAIIVESNNLYSDHWKLEKIRKEVEKNDV